MKTVNFGLLVSVFCLGVLLLAESGISEGALIPILTLLALSGLIPFVATSTKILLSPGRMYALSIVAFILARPIIFLFGNSDLVEVGNGVNVENLSKTLAVITLSIWMSGIAFELVNFNGLNYFKSASRLRFKLPTHSGAVAFGGFVILGSYFLFKSWIASRSLQTLDYFTAISDPNYFSHIKFFFAAKLLGIAWLAAAPGRDKFRVGALLMLLFSCGFLLIGLRGYFISYLFLYLYFYNEKREIKLIPIVVGVLCLLYGSSVILEYRLGFSVYNNPVEMLAKPLFQQGATFEVVFGSVSFPEKVSNCIPLVDYFMKTKPFGNCVDLARAVPFAEGGFASSFFAEAYYFGLVFLILISLAVGVALKFIDALLKIRVDSKFSRASFGAGLILFLVIPNLIYFGRGSAFDFIFKVAVSTLIFVIFYRMRAKTIPLGISFK